MAQRKLGVRGGINISSAFTDKGEDTLLNAQNYFQDVPGVLRSRRGFTRSAAQTPAPIYKIASPLELNGKVLINNGGSTGATELRAYNASGSTLTSVSGAFSNSDLGLRMQTMAARGNFYATEDNGVHAMSTALASSSVRFAGQTMGLPVSLRDTYADVTPPTVGSLWLPNGYGVAYRVVYGRNDSQGEIIGKPSGRTVWINTGGTCQPHLHIPLPKSPNSQTVTLRARVDWLDLYRAQTRPYSQGEPDDEMRLITRYYPTTTDILNGYVEFNDIVTDEVWGRGPFLYTNENTGDTGLIQPDGTPSRGISLGNETPPLARAMCMWNNRGWYADVTTRPQWASSFIALPMPGEIIQVNGVNFIAASPAVFANEYQISSLGTLSQNLMETAINFISCVNSFFLSTEVYGQYTGSSANDVGSFVLLSRTLTGGITVGAGFGSYYYLNPNADDQPRSEVNRFPGRIYFSKDGEPEAVPVVNYFQVGNLNSQIHQIVPRNNYLYIFSDAGLYRMTGQDENDFAVELVEPRCHLIARETAVTGSDGLIYALCQEGIAQIDASGVRYIQTPIENIFPQALSRIDLANANKFWFAVASSRWQSVTFFFLQPGQQEYGYTWNIPSRTWTSWNFPRLGAAEFGRSCATIQATTGCMLFANGTTTTSNAHVFFENLDISTNFFEEMDQDGNVGGLGHFVAWWPFMEAPDVKSVWREVHASFYIDTGPNAQDSAPVAQFSMSSGPDPDSIAGTIPTPMSSTLNSFPFPMPQTYISRALVPYTQARGRSLGITVTDNNTDLSSMPLECITIIYEPYTTKEVR